jgi:choline dehydrogenase
MLATPQLAAFLDVETLPGAEAQTDDELLDFAKKNGSTTYHLIGTARTGPATDPGAVVSDRLLVHGMEALRIVDASIMPAMPSANTYATTMMIAEKAADFLRGLDALPAAEAA